MMPKVLISILNWQNYKETITAIHSIKKQNYQNYTICIVDNNSPNNSVEILRKTFPKLKIIESSENKGFAAGHKLSVDFALENDYNLVWILNNDLTVEHNSLKELVDSFKRNGNGIYGSLILNEDGGTIRFAGGRELLKNGNIDFVSKTTSLRNKDYLRYKETLKEKRTSNIHGSSFLIPVSVIKQFGFLSLKFYLYGEEDDYCYRLNKQKVYSYIVSNSKVKHSGGINNIKQNGNLHLLKLYYYNRNQFFLLNTHLNFSFKKYLNYLQEEKLLYIFLYLLYYKLIYPLRKRTIVSKFYSSIDEKYYKYLGFFHAFLRIKGKYLEPSKFL